MKVLLRHGRRNCEPIRVTEAADASRFFYIVQFQGGRKNNDNATNIKVLTENQVT